MKTDNVQIARPTLVGQNEQEFAHFFGRKSSTLKTKLNRLD